jgi:tetraacyldisaccharide 4'-kinase
MREPHFWTKPNSISAFLLAPLSGIYRFISRLRMTLATPQKAQAPVICIGNFTMGGAGKTPVTDFIAQALKENGWQPAILSRGYGGHLKEAIAVDLSQHNSEDVGDEPFMLAQRHNVFIGKDRVISATLATQSGHSILIKDDGFQNPGLYHDINILVADGEKGFGNGRIFPAGPLREFADDALSRTDIVVVMGAPTGNGMEEFIGKCHGRAVPVFHAKIKPRSVSLDKTKPVLAYCAIARPQKFYNTLAEMGFNIGLTRDFSDHHYFSEAEAQSLLQQADKENLSLITTEKDAARLSHLGKSAHYRNMLLERTKVLPIDIDISDEFMSHIFSRLR